MVGGNLERSLGLYSTMMISMGAMIGSGIFVLPALGYKKAGPAVIVAYVLAGLVVLPAALSKAEMSTAMPESGGTYLYIDRALGPLFGTIAGIGAWFSLVFKSAFALAGLGAYLLLFTDVSQGALVFVSYAGVTKVASIAEEVKNPGENLPRAMLGSMVIMTLIYIAVVAAVVVLSEPETLKHGGPDGGASLTPMADGAEALFGGFGVVIISVVAIIALTSMANAGVLSSSRFPLAMSRDDLLPRQLQTIDSRFRTPRNAVLLTGSVLLFLIAFIPVIELAKLASAFQILVFSFVNVAVIAFREADLPSYEPEFITPGYPYVQLFGIFGGLGLLTQMGFVPLVGAAGIITGGVAVYLGYGRRKTDRTGALGALLAVRRGAEDQIDEDIVAGEND